MYFNMLTEWKHYVNVVFSFRLPRVTKSLCTIWWLVILWNVCVNHNLNLVFGVFLFCSTPEPCGCKLRINYIVWLRTLFRYIFINNIKKINIKLDYFIYFLCYAFKDASFFLNCRLLCIIRLLEFNFDVYFKILAKFQTSDFPNQ